ncbi:hypothetical protein MMC18_008740 [Xylographa bjoerkii]|nr:hypothetical protein [Xylographa bjoerkii]
MTPSPSPTSTPTLRLPITISPARSPSSIRTTTTLFSAYAASLDISLDFQSFSTELAALPGSYAPPLGDILLAHDAAGTPAGCIALRPLRLSADHQPSLRTPHDRPSYCELKRLYVVPAGRGLGIGKMLVERALSAAEERGYGEVRLDTLPDMRAAVRLYESVGFVRTEAYHGTLVEGLIFMGRSLGGGEVEGKRAEGDDASWS